MTGWTWAGGALAAQLAGVTIPDTAHVDGQTLVLNGVGLREKYTFDIYVGALYLERPARDARTALAASGAKRVLMHFVYSRISKDRMVESFRSDFGNLPGAEGHRADIAALVGWLPPEIRAGDELVFDFPRGGGTVLTLDGRGLGTIAGPGFAALCQSIWLGDRPPTAALQRGMLGL